MVPLSRSPKTSVLLPSAEKTDSPSTASPGEDQEQQALEPQQDRVGPAVARDRPGGGHQVLDRLPRPSAP